MVRALASSVVLASLAVACGGGSGPAAATPPASAPTPAPVARYRVSFDATWAVASHPVDFPAGAHFSPLVGATHSAGISFWTPGEDASAGIEAMAELGRTSPLDAEIQAAIDAGRASRLVRGGALDVSPGSLALEIEADRDHPLVTLVTMVAPSPDWFVGVSGLALIEGGDWVAERTVALYPWDAGTDDGVTYSSPDRDTQPRQPIRLLAGAPVEAGGGVAPFGSFTFRRLP
jgi:hypothetical protein